MYKKVLTWLCVIAICISLPFLLGGSKGTNPALKTLRAVSSTDDTGYAADGVAWSSVSSNMTIVSYYGRRTLGAFGIVIAGTNAENETINWCLYAAKKNGPAQCVAYGTATLGVTETGNTLEFYADTIVITGESWFKDVAVTTGMQYNLGTGAVVGGGIAMITLDSCEYDNWEMKMSKGTCATMGCYIINYD